MITIGIIGVVAAMTIPNLMLRYEKSVIEKNLAKTYSELQNVIRRSEADNGSFEGWSFGSSFSPIKETYFDPYIRLYPCNWKNVCFNKKYNDVMNWNGEPSGYNDWLEMYYTQDGRSIGFTWSLSGSNNILEIYVDVNGTSGKSIPGQDVFHLYISGQDETPALHLGAPYHSPMPNYTWSDEELKKTCYTVAGAKRYGRLYACGLLIQRNGWKFPSDYPFKVSDLKESL